MYPVLFDPNSTTDSHIFKIYGVGVSNCGSATVGCLGYATDNGAGRNSYADAGIIAIQGSVFDTTGNVQTSTGIGYTVTSPQIGPNNYFINDLNGFFLSSHTGFVGAFVKSCYLRGSYFDLGVNYPDGDGWGSCYIEDNAFSAAFGSALTTEKASFQRNFVMFNPAAAGDLWTNGGGVALTVANFFRNYVAYTVHGPTSVHGLGTSTINTIRSENVFEPLSTACGEGHATHSENTDGITYTYSRNLLLPGTDNCAYGMLAGWAAENANAILTTDHNSHNGVADQMWSLQWGHSDPPRFPVGANRIAAYRSNVHWASSSGAGNFAIALNSPVSDVSGAPTNSANVSEIRKNSFFNSASSTKWDSNDCGGSDSLAVGTPYSICTLTAGIGSGDLMATNPGALRRAGALQWAAGRGQAATVAGLKAAFVACPDVGWCVGNLWSTVRRWWQPTNNALRGAAHDGTDIGHIQMRIAPRAF